MHFKNIFGQASFPFHVFMDTTYVFHLFYLGNNIAGTFNISDH